MKVIKKFLIRYSIFALASFLPFLSLMNFAYAEEKKINSFKMSDHAQVTENWARETFKFAKTGAAYFTILNTHDSSPILLSGIEVDENIASFAQIHETVMEDEMMSMREVEAGVQVLPKEVVDFLPGGKHLMFMGLQRPFTKGDNISVTLHFEDGSILKQEFPVLDVRR